MQVEDFSALWHEQIRRDKPISSVERPPIRLLFAIPEPCPTFRADVTVLFGKYLSRLGVASDVITERAAGVEGEIRWGGGEVLLAAGRGGRVGKHALRLAHCIYRMFRADRARYRAIQVRDMPLVALVGLFAARWKGLPFFYWMSFPMPEGQIKLARDRRLSAGLLRFLFPWLRGRLGRFLLYRVVLPRTDHIFVQSERMREDIAAKGISKERMTPVLMGVDVEVARPERLAPSNDARLRGGRILVYLGTLDRNRRIDVLFEMLKLVRKEFQDVLLVLVGKPEDESQQRWLRQRAGQLGVADAIVWTGWLPVHEGWRYVRAATVGLSPIPRGPLLDCGSPTKAVEYLALGVPVVGNDNPDQKRILDEGGGGLCVPLTAEDFAEAVCRLLQDESLRRKMARSGQSYVRTRRSYESLAQTLADIYAQLLCLPRV